jgi:glutamate dehydrogenase
MMLTLNRVLTHAAYWLLTEDAVPKKLAPAMDAYSKGIQGLENWLKSHPSSIDSASKRAEDSLKAAGVPAELAQRVALMPLLVTALDLIMIADEATCSMDEAASAFFELGHRLGFDWLRDQAQSIAAQTPWQRDALAAITEDLAVSQRRLATAVIGQKNGKNGQKSAKKIALWLSRRPQVIERYDAMLSELRSTPMTDLAMLALASRHLMSIR